MRRSGIVICIVGLIVLACLPDPKDDPPVFTDWDYSPQWSNQGDRISFSGPASKDAAGNRWLFVIDTNGRNRTPISQNGLASTWLPGDTALIFFKDDFRLYYVNLTTMQESLLCNCSFARYPDMDPNGTHVFYEEAGVSDNWGNSVYRKDLSSGDTSYIVGGSFPSVAPDGKYLLVNRQSVFQVDLVTHEQIVVYRAALEYDWSPDGDTFLVGNFYDENLQQKIFKVRKGGGWSAYFTNGESPRYSPRGDRIVLTRISSDGKEHLWLVDRDGRNAKQITF